MSDKAGSHNRIEKLGEREDAFKLAPPTLKEKVATKVLDLFHFSLKGTLLFAAALVLIDALYIFMKVITPEQRLMSEKIIMTFIAATVVQVGAALAAIVFAVFKSNPNSDGDSES
jgi:hypothetical protein